MTAASRSGAAVAAEERCLGLDGERLVGVVGVVVMVASSVIARHRPRDRSEAVGLAVVVDLAGGGFEERGVVAVVDEGWRVRIDRGEGMDRRWSPTWFISRRIPINALTPVCVLYISSSRRILLYILPIPDGFRSRVLGSLRGGYRGKDVVS